MAMMDSIPWSSSQDHAMQSGPEDDFQQFLEMNGMTTMSNLGANLEFAFEEFGQNGPSHLIRAPPAQALDTPMSGTDTQHVLSRSDPAVLHHRMPPMTSAGPFQSIPTTMIPPPTPREAIVDSIDAQIQYLQQQKLQHQQRQLEEQQAHQAAFFVRQQRSVVPPTPQSLEIQAGNNHFYSQPSRSDQTPQQHPIDYRYQRIKEQQEISFTPLVSPAVTPLETHFPIDAQFTVPGAYFSPLTSPALHAQNESITTFESRHGGVTTSSPVEMELEGPAAQAASLVQADAAAKKPRKNTAKRAKTGVRQSPITKPQRRKTATTPIIKEQVLNELAESAEKDQEHQQQLPVPAIPTSSSSVGGATDSDVNSSVSPEALNDNVAPTEMPPPPVPKPRSAKPSPFLAPENHALLTSYGPLPGIPSPATPASLMKLSSPNHRASAGRAGSQDPIASEHIESFELPESANFPKEQEAKEIHSPRARPSVQPTSEPSPVKGSSSVQQPMHSPLVFAKPTAAASASQSPQLVPGSGSASTSARKTPQLAPRGSKKRSSISSVHVSPALRPKISPNIKPLLPGGATAEDTASHLLATKSNYQRILEGNTVPGVSYPSELSTNLTSKRTSHKIAEQGRRNRINSALQEIATLLPRPPLNDPNETEGEGGGEKKEAKTACNVPNSKASTVELAIEYIKQLKKEVEEANKRAEEAEKKLDMKQEKGE